MAKDYTYDVGLTTLNNSLSLLEANKNRTNNEIDSVRKTYELVKKMNSYPEDILKEFDERFNSLSILSNEENITPIEENPIVEQTLPIIEEEIPTLTSISPRNYKLGKKARIALGTGALAIILAASGCSLTSCIKNRQQEVAEETTIKEEAIAVPEMKEIKDKILPEDWIFDPNDNIEIVNRMSDFIYNAVKNGIPVKDVMTEDEIALAKEKDENLVTIEQLMDFYMVMNIEDIDPLDYARLQYFTKTKETIVDNYQYCARVFATDSLTATNDTVISYGGIINDKESSTAVQKFASYLAEYNNTSDKKAKGEEIFNYINSTYINKDANVYSMASNEFTYRLMFDADLISNNSIIPKDVNIILNEDGKLTCASSDKNDDGIKDKTERAEEFTSLSNAVEQKLEISREFYNQDLSDIDEIEQKTGLELENEIKEKVLSMNVEYHANEKFTMSADSKKISAKKSNSSNNNYVTFSNGKNVSKEEMNKYGAKNQAEYEAAKKAEFKKKAQEDPNHTIKDPNGKVVVDGPEVDTEQYNSGFTAGYYDGNNKLSNNPTINNESYKAGYKVGYDKGLSDRLSLDEQYKSQPEPAPEYTPVENGPVTPVEEVIVEQPYVPTEPNPEVTPEPIPGDDGTWEEFEPVNETSVTESTTTIDYTSSISRLEQMKQELLNLANTYTEEKSNTKC